MTYDEMQHQHIPLVDYVEYVDDANLAMTVDMREVKVRDVPEGTDVTITLPPLKECAGKIYTINVWDIFAGQTATVTDHGDDGYWVDQALTASRVGDGPPVTVWTSGDFLVLYADQERWYILDSQITPLL